LGLFSLEDNKEQRRSLSSMILAQDENRERGAACLKGRKERRPHLLQSKSPVPVVDITKGH